MPLPVAPQTDPVKQKSPTFRGPRGDQRSEEEKMREEDSCVIHFKTQAWKFKTTEKKQSATVCILLPKRNKQKKIFVAID